jgi:hypothetical protein
MGTSSTRDTPCKCTGGVYDIYSRSCCADNSCTAFDCEGDQTPSCCADKTCGTKDRPQDIKNCPFKEWNVVVEVKGVSKSSPDSKLMCKGSDWGFATETVVEGFWSPTGTSPVPGIAGTAYSGIGPDRS